MSWHICMLKGGFYGGSSKVCSELSSCTSELQEVQLSHLEYFVSLMCFRQSRNLGAGHPAENREEGRKSGSHPEQVLPGRTPFACLLIGL